MNALPVNHCCPKCAAPLPEDAPQGLCPKCLLLAASTPTESGTGPASPAGVPTLAEVQAAFPQLEIFELIGAGGMGAVFKARQPKLDRFVALKVLSPSLAASPAFAERFNREARVLARLSHPGIVSVFDFGQAGSLFFLLMEFVDGVNLRQAMQAGRFTPSQALLLVPKICEALQFAHDEGILHRDIKPENILLDTKGRVKIADFGIAKLVGEPRPVTKLTATGAAIGTPQYMAPEQLEHPEDVDQRADIFSLGVVFYEMLTGELPIGRFAPPSEKSPVDPRVDEVVFRTLEREREKRYRSAGEVKTQVEDIQGTPTPPPPPETSAATRETARKQVAPLATALFILGLLNCVPILTVPVFSYLALAGKPPESHIGLSGLAGVLLVPIAFGLMSGILMMVAARMLRRMAARRFAIAACVIAMIPPLSPAFLIGIPIAIWGLIVLFKPEVKAAFAPATPQTVGPGTGEVARRGPQWSWKSIIGAGLVAVSLILPVLVGIALATHVGGVGIAELVLIIAGLLLFALPGTILGWMGLVDLRVNAGRLHGLPFAVFAALAWPLGVLIGTTVVVPTFIAIPVPAGQGPPLWTRFMLLVPAGVITFAIWAVYATARWGANRPPSARRGVLKWIFLVVALALVGFVLSNLLDPAKDTAPTRVTVAQGGVESAGNRDERAVILTVAAPPREYLVVSAVVLSNRVPITQRDLRTKLWPASTSEATDFQVKWEPVVNAGSSSWDIEVTTPHDGQVLARLCPEDLPQFPWSGVPIVPKSLKAGREARELEVARALRTGLGGTEDWSVRLKLQSQPPQPTSSRRGMEADIVLPANQVAVFEVVTRSDGRVVPVTGLAAHVVNGSGEPWKGRFVWADDPDDLDGQTALPRWSFGLIGNGDRMMETGLGVPVPPPGYTGWLTLWTELKPDTEIVEGLSNTDAQRPGYGLRVRTQTIRTKPGVLYQGSGFGTNWLKEAASRLQPAEK